MKGIYRFSLIIPHIYMILNAIWKKYQVLVTREDTDLKNTVYRSSCYTKTAPENNGNT